MDIGLTEHKLKDYMNYENNIPEITLKYRGTSINTVKLCSPMDTYNLLMQMYDADTLEYLESSIVLYLNRANKLIGYQKIGLGGISGVVMDKRVILATALTSGSSAIIVSHNHPSGNLKASNSDIEITRTLKDACKLLDIDLLDSLIVTKEGYHSILEDI
jgi:DNA repair protein RadC